MVLKWTKRLALVGLGMYLYGSLVQPNLDKEFFQQEYNATRAKQQASDIATDTYKLSGQLLSGITGLMSEGLEKKVESNSTNSTADNKSNLYNNMKSYAKNLF